MTMRSAPFKTAHDPGRRIGIHWHWRPSKPDAGPLAARELNLARARCQGPARVPGPRPSSRRPLAQDRGLAPLAVPGPP